MEDEIKITKLQQELNQSLGELQQSLKELNQSLESLKKQLTLPSDLCRRIEDKYGPDYLALIQGQPVERPVKVVRKVCRILNQRGELLTVLTEKYIEKRDGTRVLLTVVCG